ncbi:MAG: excinuclease ABC subunit UvrA [Verrucomicrobiota bacterium]|nr:excinuclease ABC subunit UvrA [Verrucomicrobiota bacterium]
MAKRAGRFTMRLAVAKGFIKIAGANEHNLKNLSLEIPRDRLVLITGPSGSGKSSLAFDTLFAEGQRKYVETLSSYARQFLDQLQKPDVEHIEGLSPAIAIEQRSSGGNPRSTIATTTEIYDYLRLLFANVGQAHCPESAEPISRLSTSDIIDQLLALPEETRVMLLAPVVDKQKGEFRDVLEKLAREGFVRARIDGELAELETNSRFKLDSKKRHSIEVVVDRLVVSDKARGRLADSVETCLKWGEGKLIALHQTPDLDRSQWRESRLSNRLTSPATGKSYEPMIPRHFSFNSPYGACPACAGLGQRPVFDEGLMVGDSEKSLEDGVILPWTKGGARMVAHYNGLLKTLAGHYGVNLAKSYRLLPKRFKEALFHGSGDEAIEFSFTRGGKHTTTTKPFDGILANLNRLYEETSSETTRRRLRAFMSPQTCEVCRGQRLRDVVLAVTLRSASQPGGKWRFGGLSIMDVCQLSIDEALRFFDGLELDELGKKIAADVVHEITSRLGFLQNVGLGYLTLNRTSGTLSGGEAQRIRLATQIGAGLVGVLYILDEPSIGLHARDNDQLLSTLEGLRDLGNTVLVVEHDEETIRRADYVIDMGPGAGQHGGEVVASGSLARVLAHKQSLTGKYLRGDYKIDVPARRIGPNMARGFLELIGAAENNLRDVNLKLPLGTFTCVTGVSGSGKSTLVDGVLRRALFRKFYNSKDRPGRFKTLRGEEALGRVIVVDQSPIGRTPRSNPATYTGIFNQIRDLFAGLPASKIRGYGASRFSFNIKGGRCEKCQGGGLLKIEMNFLPPIFVICESCNGQRYNRETLEIHYKGRNIADVLDMTVDEAMTFFRAFPKICDPCATLSDVGLGYLKLGQQGTTLSGGEAQRVKLATELTKQSRDHALFILDEPTTGLHFHDVARLLDVLARLRDANNTLLIIEHNMDVIKSADWVIDLGPEGGDDGGRIVAEGPPERIAAAPGSHTGRFLAAALGMNHLMKKQ